MSEYSEEQLADALRRSWGAYILDPKWEPQFRTASRYEVLKARTAEYLEKNCGRQ